MSIKEAIKLIFCGLCKQLGGEDIKNFETLVTEHVARMTDAQKREYKLELIRRITLLIPTGLTADEMDKPSPSDIVPTSSITVSGNKVTIDYSVLNIPFTKPAIPLEPMEIPNTKSMDGYMDRGNNPLYIKPADMLNHRIMVNWLADQWRSSRGKLANDCVYRIMKNPDDDPLDFDKTDLIYAIHRTYEVGYDALGRYWVFKGVNNDSPDPFKARDKNLLFLNTGVID